METATMTASEIRREQRLELTRSMARAKTAMEFQMDRIGKSLRQLEGITREPSSAYDAGNLAIKTLAAQYSVALVEDAAKLLGVSADRVERMVQSSLATVDG